MIAHTFDDALAIMRGLVADFRDNQAQFRSANYSELDVRQQFLNKFWMALGWDVLHDVRKNPLEWHVKVEENVSVEGRGKRADYAFFAANSRDVLFFVEAKRPSRNIENAQDYFQTVRYGWHTNTPVAVLTDFEQFHVLDCRYKPDIDSVLRRGALEKYAYEDYADPEKLRQIYHLFSRAEAQGGLVLASICDKVQGGFYRLKIIYIQQLPIRRINFSDAADKARHDRVVALVEQMLAARRQLTAVRTEAERGVFERKCAAIDRQLDELVYELYGLTAEERALVEGGS